MASEIQRVTEQGVLTLPDATWDQALQRSLVIAPLAALEAVGHQTLRTRWAYPGGRFNVLIQRGMALDWSQICL